MRSKKATGLSMNTIVIGVIALIVLIVIIMIFTGKVGNVNKETDKISKEYSKDKCNIAGTSRTCSGLAECNNKGGTSFGELDCLSGICCSK